MKKLTATQIKTKNDLTSSLVETADRIRKEIHGINTFLVDARERIEHLEELYAAQVEAANAFAESIHDTQDAYMSERSEAWASSDNGDMYRDWADEWQLTLEAVEIEFPDELEEPDLEDLESFRDLPDQP